MYSSRVYRMVEEWTTYKNYIKMREGMGQSGELFLIATEKV